jgi:hypothetical protein
MTTLFYTDSDPYLVLYGLAHYGESLTTHSF